MKYNIKLNVDKLASVKTEKRTYVNKNGETVALNEMKLDIVVLDEQLHKKLTVSNGKELVKVGFVAEPSTKSETGEWINGAILGDVTVWRAETEKSYTDITDEANDFIKSQIEADKEKAKKMVDDIPF